MEKESTITSSLKKVPGCVATVKVQTVLSPIDSTESSHDAERFRVWINGTSDAMLSRGLLACLSEAVSGLHVSAYDVLQMDPESVSNQLHLDRVLSRGRNDGLASMMRTVQEQIRSLLGQNDSDRHETTDEVRTVRVGSHESTKPKTVAMLLSGGVDSSVALNLLKRDGFEVTAFYLKIWLEDELAHLGQCPWEDDYQVCKEVCQQAGVPLETVSLQAEYKQRVISYTVNEARRGRTPNPDVMCNSRVKFGCFYDAISERGFDHVASGHYAQLVSEEEENDGRRRLFRAPDPVKDQSYFLCALTQDQLKRVLFPIGHLQKSEVRELAQDFTLPNRHRPDSQGLCFLGKVKFAEFLEAYLGEKPGSIIDAASGEVLGQHRGVWYHTVGQRKGIGKVLDPQATSRGPWYVVAKDPDRNVVFVSNQYDEEAFTVARSDFYVEDIQWIVGEPPVEQLQRETTASNEAELVGRFHFKIRHGPKLVEGTLALDGKGGGGHVRLDAKDGGLAPGQFVVFYTLNGGECLGSGVISERHWAKFLLDREVER